MKFCLFFAVFWTLNGQESRNVIEARRELERVQWLIGSGALPPAKGMEARQNLEDAIDEALLRTRPSATELTEQQAADLVAAAQRLVDRVQAKLTRMQALVSQGAAPVAVQVELEREVSLRREDLERARELEALLHEIATMARAEVRPPEEKTNGTRLIQPKELDALSMAFENKFSEPLPISARGMTAVHKALGLDHTGRVDVALSPDSPEGQWLRDYLSLRGIPYFAFRTAIPGKATAPHIHIGPGSTRLF
jgi:hypothetical protein